MESQLGLRSQRRARTQRVGRLRRLALSISVLLLLPSVAAALSFQVDFRTSTYQVVGTDSYASLLAQHESEALITTNTLIGLEGISAPIYAGGVNQNYSLLMTTNIEALVTGVYTFQVGTDWGRGGASIVIDNDTGTTIDEFVTTDDIWWDNDWSNSDVFTSTLNMTAGSSYTLGWIGFEGCCGGEATIRFSIDGAPFQPLNSNNGDPAFVNNPEPGTGILLGLGLIVLATRVRSRAKLLRQSAKRIN